VREAIVAIVVDVNAAIPDDLDRDSRKPTVKVRAQSQNENALDMDMHSTAQRLGIYPQTSFA
jgi:hypothetical protein